MTLTVGSVLNMKTFSHVTGPAGRLKVSWHFKKPGKDQTYVFMFMGIETEGKSLDLMAVMDQLGWKAKDDNPATTLSSRDQIYNAVLKELETKWSMPNTSVMLAIKIANAIDALTSDSLPDSVDPEGVRSEDGT